MKRSEATAFRAKIKADSEKVADFKTLLAALPPGQRKNLLKDAACAEILKKYGVTG